MLAVCAWAPSEIPAVAPATPVPASFKKSLRKTVMDLLPVWLGTIWPGPVDLNPRRWDPSSDRSAAFVRAARNRNSCCRLVRIERSWKLRSLAPESGQILWWAHQDLNLEPTDYESAALTN